MIAYWLAAGGWTSEQLAFEAGTLNWRIAEEGKQWPAERWHLSFPAAGALMIQPVQPPPSPEERSRPARGSVEGTRSSVEPQIVSTAGEDPGGSPAQTLVIL